MALYIRKDFYQAKSDLVLNEIKRTSDLVSRLTGMQVPANKAIIGANAYAHESGIHQDGMLKEKTTYEIISPELVGVSSNSLVLGKHSGRHAFKERLQELNFSVTDEEMNSLFVQFKELADNKKTMTDEDIVALVLEEKAADLSFYELTSLQISHGTHQTATATVTLKKAIMKKFRRQPQAQEVSRPSIILSRDAWDVK